MFDSTDFKIIQLLQGNARMNWKEIGGDSTFDWSGCWEAN